LNRITQNVPQNGRGLGYVTDKIGHTLKISLKAVKLETSNLRYRVIWSILHRAYKGELLRIYIQEPVNSRVVEFCVVLTSVTNSRDRFGL